MTEFSFLVFGELFL